MNRGESYEEGAASHLVGCVLQPLVIVSLEDQNETWPSSNA